MKNSLAIDRLVGPHHNGLVGVDGSVTRWENISAASAKATLDQEKAESFVNIVTGKVSVPIIIFSKTGKILQGFDVLYSIANDFGKTGYYWVLVLRNVQAEDCLDVTATPPVVPKKRIKQKKALTGTGEAHASDSVSVQTWRARLRSAIAKRIITYLISEESNKVKITVTNAEVKKAEIKYADDIEYVFNMDIANKPLLNSAVLGAIAYMHYDENIDTDMLDRFCKTINKLLYVFETQHVDSFTTQAVVKEFLIYLDNLPSVRLEYRETFTQTIRTFHKFYETARQTVSATDDE